MKYHIIFVEPSDEDSTASMGWMVDADARSLALEAHLLLQELWSALEKAGVLSVDELAAARQQVKRSWNLAVQERFDRVEDVDDLNFRRGS